MEGKIVAAIGGCAVMAGVAYVLQGRNKLEGNKHEQSGSIPGLANLGNTCYLNSVLQALASVAAFVSWIKICSEEMKKQNPQKLCKLTLELSAFMQILSKPCYDQESYDPTVIYKTLYSHGWVISLEQQDAHELFQVLTSTLAEEQDLPCQNNWNSVLADELPTRNDDGIILRSGASATKLERKSCSPFVGLFANQLSCKVCSNKFPVKFDSFDTISLSLSSNFQFGCGYSLPGLIRHFMCSEVLESFECPGCRVKDGETKKRRLLKKLSIGKLPQCLCFHINRTYWQNNGVPYKNNTFVKFFETLNIEPFLYSTSKLIKNTEQDPRLSKNSSISTTEQITKTISSQTRPTLSTIYSLVAVIVHMGGVENGHYVTYRKTQWQDRVRWDLVSDEMTRAVPVSRVLNSNAYMLFYERTAQ